MKDTDYRLLLPYRTKWRLGEQAYSLHRKVGEKHTMVGEQATTNMSKKNDKDLASQLASLTQEAIQNGATVQQVPAVETETDSEVTLSGKVLPVRDVATYVSNKGTLRLDLVALKGHKVADSVNIAGYGDVLVTASLGRLKSQPKPDESLKDKQVRKLSAEALTAFNAGQYAEAKELTARVDAIQRGETSVVLDSNRDSQDINLGLGSIEGNRFVFGRSAKGNVLWIYDQKSNTSVAHRLRFTVSRGLFENEYPQPTERQKVRASLKERAKVEKGMTRDADIAAQKVAWMIEQKESAS